MQYMNKFNGKESGEMHSNICDSNDFDRIVDEINQEKQNKNAYMMQSMYSKNEFDKSKGENEKEQNNEEKQMNHTKLQYRNNNNNNEKKNSMNLSIDDISIFPYATSLVQTAESKENYIPSNSIKNAKLTKTKKNNSLKKFDDSYNIDTYEKITNSFINKTEKKEENAKRKNENETYQNNRNRNNSLERKKNQNIKRNYSKNNNKPPLNLGNPFEEEIETIEFEMKKQKKNGKDNKQLNVITNNEYQYEKNSYDNDIESKERKNNEHEYIKNHNKNDIFENEKMNESSDNVDSSNIDSPIMQRKLNRNKSKNGNKEQNVIDNEKEENNATNPFVLSVESLDKREKEYNDETKNKNSNKISNKMKNIKKKDPDDQESNENESEGNKEFTITETYDSIQDASYSVLTNNQQSLHKNNASKKEKTHIKEKESSIELNVKNVDTKSNATTIDSDYSFNEQMNIAYENFKLYNKNKMYYIINQEKKKNELLEALNTEKSLKLRKVLRIMREFYTGFIGIQLIYFITTILMGMSNIYLLQIFSLSCTIFSILDANYHGYLLNGFINLSISILFTLACTQAIPGFEDLQTNSTLKNIAISNIVLLFLFSFLSFINGLYIYKLHSIEKKCIKKVINTIEQNAMQPAEKKIIS